MASSSSLFDSPVSFDLLQPPKLRILQNYNLDYESDVGFSEDFWEISVPAKNSLPWSITLAYLFSLSDDKLQLQRLLGDEQEIKAIREKKNITGHIDSASVGKSLKKFNPFKNKHSFFDNTLINVMRIFDLRLKRHAYSKKKKAESWDEKLKLWAAADMLKCPIKVFSVNNKAFFRYPEKTSPGNRNEMFLLMYEDVDYQGRERNIFHFTMKVEFATELRDEALVFILKKAKIPNSKIESIKCEQKKEQNFLVSLFRGNNADAIPALYYSHYIILKLSEAGFITSPTVCDTSGLSAFYHAIIHPDREILRILYDYATNCGQLSEKFTKDPDNFLLQKFEDIDKILKQDRQSSNNFTICQGAVDAQIRALRTSLEYSQLCEYQKKLLKGKMNEKCDVINGVEVKECKKNFMLFLLDNYIKFFDYEISEEKSMSEIFHNYIKFNEYYDNLDNFTCSLFFDNFYSLKEQYAVKENLDAYIDIESAFCLLALCSKLFSKLNHPDDCRNCSKSMEECEDEMNILRLVPFCHRLELKDNIIKFIKILSTPEKKNGNNRISKNDLQINLSKFPEIKDELSISRIRIYVKAASEVSFEATEKNAVLTIERILQVIGESVKSETTEKCFISLLLRSCLPNELINQLKEIRNKISKWYTKWVQGRVNKENDIALYKALQKEVIEIEKVVELVYTIQKPRTKDFLMSKCHIIAQLRFSDKTLYDKINEAYKKEVQNQKIHYSKHISEYKIIFRNLLDYAEKCIDGNEIMIKDAKVTFYALNYIFTKLHTFIPHECSGIILLDTVNKCEEALTFLKELGKEERKKHTDVVEQVKQGLVSLKTESDVIFANTAESILLAPCEYSKIKSLLDSWLKFEYFNDNDVSYLKDRLEYCLQNGICLNTKGKMNEKDNERELEEKLNKMLNEYNIPAKFWKIIIKPHCPQIREKVQFLQNRKLHFFVDRMKILRAILIEEDEDILQLWKYGRSEEIKVHNKYRIVGRYMKELGVRVPLEMVLLDCLNTLQWEEFESFHIKTDGLFAGINIRDVLAHGNRLIEAISDNLNPRNLHIEFVNKMLEFIDDSEAVNKMFRICEEEEIETSDELNAKIETELSAKNTEKSKEMYLRMRKYAKHFTC